MLKIYNTLTRIKQEFKPLQPDEVSFYACGMTVYDYCHIGHARSLIVFDIIVRYLRYLKYNVKYVRNFTDIEDKIIKRANENNEDFRDLTKRFIDAMHEDCEALNLLSPDEEPCATQYMGKIINIVQILVDKGFAYVGANGDVYYDIAKFKDYGKLSRRDIEQLQAGVRIDISESKNNPLDFTLWKLAKPGEPSWESPWGAGRPGWHIECSAMSTDCLGKRIDIHAGGQDLVFPHHENEIAQSEAATGEQFVNYWIHTGMLLVDGQKMSKSLGNFFTIRDILKEFPAEVLRYFMSSSHYRSPLNYSKEGMKEARQALERLYTALRDFTAADLAEAQLPDDDSAMEFAAAMNDDFNTPQALAALFNLAHQINKLKSSQSGVSRARQLSALLKKLGGILGILQQDPQEFFQSAAVDVAHIEAMIVARNDARKNKNWAEADRIRDELLAQGIVLEDGAAGTSWKAQ